MEISNYSETFGLRDLYAVVVVRRRIAPYRGSVASKYWANDLFVQEKFVCTG